MKINQNDLKRIIQESVVKMMNEGGLLDELYLEGQMNSLADMLTKTAEDFIANLDSDRVNEEVKYTMLDNIESEIKTAVDNARRDALYGHY